MAFVEIVGSENRLKRSQDISSGVWQVLSGTVKTANVVAGPDGTISGGKLTFGGATNSGLMQAGNGAMVSGKDYTYSIWVKGVVGGETIKLLLSDGISASLSSVLTATTKWKRYSVTKTSAGTNAGSVQIRNATTDTGKEVYIWGGQLEESKTASSYKKTTINVVTPSAGSDGVWEFEDSATVSNTYPDSADGANTTVAGGVRTYNKPGDENGGQELSYLRTRVMGQVNILKKSENLISSSGYWNATRTTLTKGFEAPDGSLNASSVIPNTDNNTHRLDAYATSGGPGDNNGLMISGQTYTASIYAKAHGYNLMNLTIDETSNNPTTNTAIFNLSTGTLVSTETGTTAGIQSVGDNWYRVFVSKTFNLATDPWSNRMLIGVINNSNAVSYAGDGSSGILCWGGMLGQSDVIEKYIPTDASASTTIERGEVSKTFFDAQ